MIRKLPFTILISAIAVALTATAVLAATIDPVNRTVTTGAFFVDWSESNPEEIVDIRWMGSPNLTNTAAAGCGGDLEYFGNSWVSENEGTPSFFFASLVGWGTTGLWGAPTAKKVEVDSISSGCYGSAEIPIQTNYQFYDSGAAANRIKIQRQFAFGSTPYTHDVRPYIPRLYPQDGFTQVLHPDAAGASLLAESTTGCDFGCTITDWDGTWFAIHDPAAGSGLIVRRAPSSVSVALWVDKDDASFTNSSSVLLLQPYGGFTGKVTETEFLCFYNSSIWTPSLALPPGC
ncbi:MAG: hypothetical protein ACM3QS_13135 [Bacteroidota bacterium]